MPQVNHRLQAGSSIANKPKPFDKLTVCRQASVYQIPCE